jgi:hypothetical protein
MFVKVRSVRANDDYTVTLLFDNGQEKRYDVYPLLNEGIFQMLQDKDYFRQVHVIPAFGGIEWTDGQDIAPEELYQNAVPVNTSLKSTKELVAV